MSGTNEAGLTIQATVLRNKAPPPVPPEAYGVHSTQWIQYHLDTSATVDEVIEKSVRSPKLVMPRARAYNIEFQVCDLSGCATIAYHDGKAVAHGTMGRLERDLQSGQITFDPTNRFEASVIANDDSEDSLKGYAQCQGSACGDDNVAARFALAARAVQRHASDSPAVVSALVPSVFEDLAALDQGAPLTTWDEVYWFDPARKAVRFFYKSPKTPASGLHWVDVSSQDFDCKKPSLVFWLDMDHAGGDQRSLSTPYTPEVQRRLVMQHVRPTGGVFTVEQARSAMEYPENSTRCLDR
jgi:hypothetical protein